MSVHVCVGAASFVHTASTLEALPTHVCFTDVIACCVVFRRMLDYNAVALTRQITSQTHFRDQIIFPCRMCGVAARRVTGTPEPYVRRALVAVIVIHLTCRPLAAV